MDVLGYVDDAPAGYTNPEGVGSYGHDKAAGGAPAELENPFDRGEEENHAGAEVDDEDRAGERCAAAVGGRVDVRCDSCRGFTAEAGIRAASAYGW